MFCLAEKRVERTCGEEKIATPGWTEKKRSSAPLRRGGVPQKIYWEGINLNKISKKIVSLVTMAAFALTLIPAAAFAADEAPAVEVTSKNIVVDNGVASVDVKVTPGTDTGDSIILWVEGENEEPATNVDYAGSADEWQIGQGVWADTTYLSGATYTTGVTYTAKVNIDAPGVYNIHVGVQDTAQQGVNDTTPLTPLVGGSTVVDTVTVYPAAPLSNSNISMSVEGSANNTVDATVGEAFDVNYSILANGAAAMMPAGTDLNLWASADDNNAAPVGVMSVTGETDAAVYTLANPAKSPVEVTFNVDGIYTLFLGYKDANGDRVVLQKLTVNVAAPASSTEIITFNEDQADGTVNQKFTGAWNNTGWTYTLDDEVVPNDVKTYTVKGIAYEDYSTKAPAKNQTLTVSSTADDITIKTASVETKDDGSFSIQFTMDDPGSYPITVLDADDNVKATLTVVSDNVALDTIKTTEDGGVLLAGNDVNYIGNEVESMADAIQFEITDTYGHVQSGDAVLAGETAATSAVDRSEYIKVNAPDDSDLEANNLILDWDNSANAYTLYYVGNNAAKDLVVGDYTVEVSLNNGKKAVADFTVANFGEIEELTLDLSAQSREADNAQNDSITVLDEQVALGQRVIVEPMYVDANGLKIKADDVSLTAEGAAVESRHLSGADRYFDLFWNIPSNQSLIGTVVTVQAYDETNHNYVERELTVVDAYQNETLAFDPTQGEVGESNTVNVTVEANDAISKVNGTMSAYIASQSNEEATIDLDVQKNVVNGEGKLFLQSDAEGTVDVVVAVKANNGEIYANTLTFTFGDEDPYAGSYIVMTIGSDQYLINGEMFDGSVDNLGAPYVDSAWRTMVPVRVLAESFGANVDYADNVVTIVDGDTTVVMNIGEETYTVNGEEKAMDTAAVIGDDDRTYVPVRFVAEALGYSVTPLYDANGLTSSVHFSK